MLDWERIQQWLIDFIQDHWLKAASALAAMIGTSLWAFFWAWRSWRNRSDLDVLHISLNTIHQRPSGPEGQLEPWLILDVIYENPLHEVVTHPMPRRLIKHAARHTTESQPFLRFDEADRWYVLNIIRLAIAETCAVATIAKLAPRAQVEQVDCLFAITYERYRTMRQGKLRVMLVPQSLMDDGKAFYPETMRYESGSHADRLLTLRKMQDDYRSDRPEFCMDVRLNVLV